VTLIREQKCRVIFAIVTRKDAAGRSQNLPLFSRISLMRNMKSLQLMNMEVHYVFVEDRSGDAEGRKKKRKKRAAAGEVLAIAADVA
jgi:hypothetical protein